MRLRNWLFNHFKEVSRLFGYEEVDFLVLDTKALFIRKAGEEIRDQVSNFFRILKNLETKCFRERDESSVTRCRSCRVKWYTGSKLMSTLLCWNWMGPRTSHNWNVQVNREGLVLLIDAIEKAGYTGKMLKMLFMVEMVMTLMDIVYGWN